MELMTIVVLNDYEKNNKTKKNIYKMKRKKN